MKTILTLEGVLKQVKEIGISARRDTYAAIADRIFPTPACLEEIRNAVRLTPISEEVHAEMNSLPAALEAKRAREFCTRDQSWADVIASRVLGFQAELEGYQFLVEKKLLLPVIKPVELKVGDRYFVRDLAELWGEVVNITDDGVSVKLLYDRITHVALYEMRMWLGDGTLAKVTPDLYEILLDDGQWLYIDTIVFSGVSATAYWNRGYNGIGTKDIPYDQIVSITRGDVKVFPWEADIEMVKARVLTREEKEQAASELAKRLAEKGIYAMYGGRKGHGFWLYRVGVEMAKELLEAFDPEKFWDLADSFEQTPIIKNDGKKSGNPCFWMFDDALKLAEAPVSDPADR
jgi:hypothetical protein